MNNIEAINFFEGLNGFFDREEVVDRQQKQINEYAEFLIEKGREFDPFKPENFGEAINEVVAANPKVFAAFLGAAYQDANYGNDYSNMCAIKALGDAITDYWRETAKKNLTRNGPRL